MRSLGQLYLSATVWSC